MYLPEYNVNFNFPSLHLIYLGMAENIVDHVLKEFSLLTFKYRYGVILICWETCKLRAKLNL